MNSNDEKWEIGYSNHAEKRLKERGISKKYVKSVLIDFDSIESFGGNKFVSRKEIKGRKLAVVFVKDKEYYKVVTGYYEN